MRNEKEAIAFGRAVRKERREAGLTQLELAESVGMNRTHLSSMERGLKAPTITMICRIAGKLGKPPALLVSRTSAELLVLEREFASAARAAAVCMSVSADSTFNGA